MSGWHPSELICGPTVPVTSNKTVAESQSSSPPPAGVLHASNWIVCSNPDAGSSGINEGFGKVVEKFSPVPEVVEALGADQVWREVGPSTEAVQETDSFWRTTVLPQASPLTRGWVAVAGLTVTVVDRCSQTPVRTRNAFNRQTSTVTS